MSYDDELMLLDMICESNDDVRNSLYKTYEPTIKGIVRKYVRTAQKLGLDLNDLMQEANVGFSDALNKYDAGKEASLKTFISLCIERRIMNYISKNQTLKSKITQESLSLDYDYDKSGLPLMELIGDETLDPSRKFMDQDSYQNSLVQIKESLSESEYEVFRYLLKGWTYIEIADVLQKSPKQIDNTIQRIRTKLRAKLKEEKNDE